MSGRAEASIWRRLFVEHPDAVRESYREHAGVAARIGGRLLGMGAACLCHALVPGLFPDTASRGVSKLAAELQRRRCCAEETWPSAL